MKTNLNRAMIGCCVKSPRAFVDSAWWRAWCSRKYDSDLRSDQPVNFPLVSH
jgi:hypothetical protein